MNKQKRRQNTNYNKKEKGDITTDPIDTERITKRIL